MFGFLFNKSCICFISDAVWEFGCGVLGVLGKSINDSLVPSNFFAHLRREDLDILYQTLYDIGFDAVFDSSIIYEYLGEKIETYASNSSPDALAISNNVFTNL